MTASRLASGPLGPTSTFGTRRKQKAGSAAAIIEACSAVLEDDARPCPSIENVLAAGAGFSRSTLNRRRYKAILHAAKARHAAREAGEWREGDQDALERMRRDVEAGTWVEPGAPERQCGDAPSGDGDGIADMEAGSDGPPDQASVETSALAQENAILHNRVARLNAEVQRRDDQLYHAVQTAQLWSRTIRRLRSEIAKLNDEIGAIQAEPWEPRERGEWRDDEDDEEWPENG